MPQRRSCQFWSNVRGNQLPFLDLPLQLLLLQNKNVYFKTKPVTDLFEITKVEKFAINDNTQEEYKSYLQVHGIIKKTKQIIISNYDFTCYYLQPTF